MNNESDYELTLKRFARIGGFVLLLISAYFSYDGFDQGVTGGNSAYSTLAKGIGIVFCVIISMFQFILSSRYDQLNLTLKVIGFASYVYSIYTNYLGAVHIMGMSTEMALAVAFFFDVAPEPAIAWSFGDSMKGDLFGNLMKTVLGSRKPQSAQSQQQFHPKPAQLNTQRPQNQDRGGGFRQNETSPKFKGVRQDLREKIGKH